MSLTITLSSDVETALTERARAQGRAVEEYAAEIVSQTVMPIPTSPRPKQGTPEWLAEFRTWMAEVVSRPPVTHFVDDSRDSIYGGPDERGER